MTDAEFSAPEPRFVAGMELAADRLRRYEIPYAFDEIQPSVGLAVEVLNEASVGNELSERGADFFFEAVAVAAVMRRRNGEPDLTSDDVRAFLAASLPFLNGFWHVDY
jgi:hypothetical protein